jgi:hypothetical protein
VDLAGDGKDILLEVGGDFGVVLVVGLAVEQGEVGGVDGESFFQNGEDAVFFDFAIEAFEDEPLPVGAVLEFGEFGGLGGFKDRWRRYDRSRRGCRVRSGQLEPRIVRCSFRGLVRWFG